MENDDETPNSSNLRPGEEILAEDLHSQETRSNQTIYQNLSTNSQTDIGQAHIALNTAYSSLKTRLQKCESENLGLKRELRSMQSLQNILQEPRSPLLQNQANRTVSTEHSNHIEPGSSSGQSSATEHRLNGLKESASTGTLLENEGVNTLSNGILRNPRGDHIGRLKREDGAPRHGSWGFPNDQSGALNGDPEEYCKLLQTQMEQVELDRDQKLKELKEVRTKLTEMSLKENQAKRIEQSLQQSQAKVRDLEKKVANAELQNAELRRKNEHSQRACDEARKEKDHLHRQFEDVRKENEHVHRLYEQIQQAQLTGHTLAPTQVTAPSDDIDCNEAITNHLHQLNVIALQATTELKKARTQLSAQKQMIGTLQAKLEKFSRNKMHGTRRSDSPRVNTTHPGHMTTSENLTPICQAEDDNEDKMAASPSYKLGVCSKEPELRPKPTQHEQLGSTHADLALQALHPLGHNLPRSPHSHRVPREHNVSPSTPSPNDLHHELYCMDLKPEANDEENTHNFAITTHGERRMSSGDDAEETMTRVTSEDITINLDNTSSEVTKMQKPPPFIRPVDRESHTTPPSPCNRHQQGKVSSFTPSHNRIVTSEQINEPTETSTASSDDVPVRRPGNRSSPIRDLVNSYVLVQENRRFPPVGGNAYETSGSNAQGMGSPRHKYSSHGGNHYSPDPTRTQVVRPSPRNTTELGYAPDVRPKQSNLLQDVRPRTQPRNNNKPPLSVMRDPPLPLSPLNKSSTIPRETENPIKRTQSQKLSQSLPRQQSSGYRGSWAGGVGGGGGRTVWDGDLTLPPPPHSRATDQQYLTPPGVPQPTHHHNTPQRTDQYLTTPMSNPGIKSSPVENEEKQPSWRYQQGLAQNTARDDGEAKRCFICNFEFPPHATLDQKEIHINSCLANDNDNNTPEDTGQECPVCKQKFPVGTLQSRFEEHVHSHFGEAVNDTYEIVSKVVT